MEGCERRGAEIVEHFGLVRSPIMMPASSSIIVPMAEPCVRRRQHGARERSLRVGRRIALRIDGPAFGQRFTRPAVQLDLAPGRDRSREVEDVGRLARAAASRRRRGWCEQRLVATCRCDRGIARAHDEPGKPFSGERLRFRPERRKMRAVVDGERGDAVLAGTLGKHRQARVRRRDCETAPAFTLTIAEASCATISGSASGLTLPALTVRSAPSIR